jgi:quinol monooxygenase YgiN
MIGIVATLKIRPEAQAAFEQAMKAFVATVREKEGDTLFYSLTRKQGSTTDYVMMEQYRSEAAVQAHNTTPHFQALLGQIGPLLAGAPDIVTTDVLA